MWLLKGELASHGLFCAHAENAFHFIWMPFGERIAWRACTAVKHSTACAGLMCSCLVEALVQLLGAERTPALVHSVHLFNDKADDALQITSLTQRFEDSFRMSLESTFTGKTLEQCKANVRPSSATLRASSACRYPYSKYVVSPCSMCPFHTLHP